MRFAVAAFCACVCLACGAGVNPSNGAKLDEALVFAAVAGAAQVAQSAAEQHARNSAPVGRSSAGMSVTPECDNDGQYPCVTVTAWPSGRKAPDAEPGPGPGMSDGEARDYVLRYINGVRKLNGVGALVRDESMDAFARAGSDELADDHRPHRHSVEHAHEILGSFAEIQGPADGSPPGPIEDRIGEILLGFMGEGSGAAHHDVILRADWRKLGVAIVSRAERMYFTVDFSN